ncbi:tetratricopeptide repeat protein 19, mitochondrial isoform X2 [Conger conger]|uniref:tetratricopeptide repeat protein 19, mitochondrial isoform X2 n=1 Tax=Conger conger TaxID=82655 RepID=UPI002A5A9A3E|nr:tetratricopeptide repeat protein 19, mitochondrial isoform X2 [Conger conger]
MAFCSVFRLLLKHRARFQTVVLDWTRTQCLWSLAHVQMRALKWENAVTSRSVEEEQHARHGRSCKLRSAVCSGEGSGDSRTDSINKHFILYSFFAFSFFGKSDEEDEAKKTEDEIIMLLKRAKLSIMQDELEAASGYLHQAIRLAHQSHNNQAIIYTYSLMANLAFVQGQLTNAEKLFKAAMSFLLSGGTSQDDNAVIEMSLKLATIYATQKRHELADHGFRFCIESLEAKIENQKDLPEDALPGTVGHLRVPSKMVRGMTRYRCCIANQQRMVATSCSRFYSVLKNLLLSLLNRNCVDSNIQSGHRITHNNDLFASHERN